MTDTRADWLERVASNMQLDYPDLPIALGVGDGSGSLFVYGGDAATKTCQEKLLKLEAIENQISTLTEENNRLRRKCGEPTGKAMSDPTYG